MRGRPDSPPAPGRGVNTVTPARPVWRSALFVPVNVDRFVDRAHERNADAIVLDLEDSIAPAEKDRARSLVAAAAAKVSRNGAAVIVRINRPWRLAAKDLEAVVGAHIRTIIVPKATDAGHLRTIDEMIGELELEQRMPVGQIGLIAEIETVEALFHARAIAAACDRLVSVFLGGEDFALSAGMEADEKGLFLPALQVAFAARAAGLVPLGFVGSIADYSDLTGFRRMIRRSRHLGFRGGFCIHPTQVRVLNEEFMPSAGEVRLARAVFEAYETALTEGRGATTVEGRMIDQPHMKRARDTLETHERFAGKAPEDH